MVAAMVLGKMFSALFGESSGQEPPGDPVDYKGFVIEPAPILEDGKYRTAGYISGELDGETRRIQFIRADQCNTRDEAIELAIFKGSQIIDQQGQSLLSKTHL